MSDLVLLLWPLKDEKMELTEIARGHLWVMYGTKSVTIYGEAFLRGHGSPDFVLYQKSIENWDAPNDQEKLTAAEKDELIQYLEGEFRRRQMVLEIE